MSRNDADGSARYESAKTPGTRTLKPSRGRTGTLVTIVVALIASMVLQQWAYSFRSKAVHVNRGNEGGRAPSRLANLDSFSLALLLGGLRGPLVMFLWTSSETQKSEKDLESFDTQVELIRLLQGEFATVHLFQMWNKAYNISVQMASLANKYAAILDAIKYGEETDKAYPNDINVLMTIGSLYADKLGNSNEKDYYRKRVRTETLPVYRVTMPIDRVEAFRKAVAQAGIDETRLRVTNSPDGKTASATLEMLPGDRVKAVFGGPGIEFTAVPRQVLRPKSHGGRRTEMDTVLDASGNLLPQYVTPRRKVSPGKDENNGAELQYLEKFQPFAYGVSPIALGYNYYKRTQVLQDLTKQRHIQLSDLVVDNQPAIALKYWAQEEFDRGRRLEFAGLVKSRPDADGLKRDLKTASLGASAQVADRFSIDEAIFSYDRSIQVVNAAFPEYQRHVQRYPSNLQNYSSHMDELRAMMHLAEADASVLRAVLAKDAAQERQKFVDLAKKAYREAGRQYAYLILHYYTEEEDAKAAGYDRRGLEGKSPEELGQLLKKLDAHLLAKYKRLDYFPHSVDREEYNDALARIEQRMKAVQP